MKQFVTLLLLLLTQLATQAQVRTTQATLYRSFKPSVITLKDGRKLNQNLTNVFLKNSSLLYLKGEYTMEANMDNILAVDFNDRSYVVIGNQLAWVLDTIQGNALLCIELFDKEGYERNLRNNVNISSLDLGDQISMSTVDLNNEEDYKMPVFRHFYFRLDGKYVKVHERDLSRCLDKEQRTMMKRIVHLDDFSWQSEESLKLLLRTLTK